MRILGKIGTAFRVLRTQGLRQVMDLVRQKLHSGSKDGDGISINQGGSGVVGVVDVGSVGGLPSEWWRHKNEINFLVSFEPRDTPLISENVIKMNTALWSETCTRDFHIYRGFRGSGSSLFMQNYDYVRTNWDSLKNRGQAELANTWFDRSTLVRTEKLHLRPLDEVLREIAPQVPFHFLKIDAQGAEYEILRGAERLLTDSCIALHLELFVLPMYQGIRLLPEVEEYLREKGFRLVKKFTAHGTFNSQHNCLFMKEGTDSSAARAIRSVYDL